MKIYSVESSSGSSTEKEETFIIEPLDLGQGVTIGNTLRRVLLSEIYGFAIDEIQINNILHEFSTSPFLKDDTLEIILNLKHIVLKPTSLTFFSEGFASKALYKSLTRIKGPAIVTAGMLNIPNYLKVLNPNQYICTISNASILEICISICYDKGYKLTDIEKDKNPLESAIESKSSPINLCPVFTPIKKVNFKIKAINDTKGNIKESLILKIETNGALTPAEALQKSVSFCLKLFYPILSFLIKKNLKENFYKGENIINFL